MIISFSMPQEITEPFKSVLVSSFFFQSSLVLSSFSVQLNRLYVENNIWANPSTQHLQLLNTSTMDNKKMFKPAVTKQPHFPFQALAGATPFRYACLAKHSCISGSGGIWTEKHTSTAQVPTHWVSHQKHERKLWIQDICATPLHNLSFPTCVYKGGRTLLGGSLD